MSDISESRGAQRRRTLKGGSIVFNGGRSTIDCTVRNISRNGAKLDVASVVGVPNSFDLLFGEQNHPCRVVWRSLKQLGVEFRVDTPS